MACDLREDFLRACEYIALRASVSTPSAATGKVRVGVLSIP